jgi:hypothetical protein
MIDPDIAKVLRAADIDPAKATIEQITLADRMLLIYTMPDGKPRHTVAGEALWRRLNGSKV